MSHVETQLGSAEYDAVVVGAGPAGTTAARELALRGARVLVVDRATFPRYKVCGCCLNARAMSLVEPGRVRDTVVREGWPLNAFHFYAAGRRTSLGLPGGVALSRERFDGILADAAKDAGATFIDGCSASVGAVEDGARRVTLTTSGNEIEVTAKIVLVCAGLGKDVFKDSEEYVCRPSRNSYIGAGAIIENQNSGLDPGSIQMAYSRHGYLGAVLVEGDRINLAAALDPDFVRGSGGLANAAAAILEESGAPSFDGVRDARWRGTPALTRSSERMAVERVFLLGDNAGYIEPFTGEGIAWAIEAGKLVAPLVLQGLEGWRTVLEREWTTTFRKKIQYRQRQCRVVSVGLRSYRGVKAASRMLDLAPALASPFIHRMNLTATHFSEG